MTTEKTRLALRVLTALSNREQPTEHDVALLRRLVPDHQGLDLDELACIVIQEAVQQTAKARLGIDGSSLRDSSPL